MGNDWLLVFLAVPAVELDASASGQQDSSVHFDGRFATELASDQVRVVRRVDYVVAQRLVHVLVQVESVQKDWRIVVRHQVVVEALDAQSLLFTKVFVHLVGVYQSQDAGPVVVGEQDLVEARIALKLDNLYRLVKLQ